MSNLETVRYQADVNNDVNIHRQATRNLQRVDVSYDDYFDRLDEINDTWRLFKDPQTGLQFEGYAVNEDKLSQQAVIKPQTEFSSATQNIGNIIEDAAIGAEKPNTGFIVLSWNGNGGSALFPHQMRKQVMETGRFTHGIDTQPNSYSSQEYFQAMARAIETEFGVVPAHVSADVAGARVALGLTMAFDHNAVKDFYLNGPPGISGTTHYTTVGLIEDIKDRQARKFQKDYIPGEVTSESKKDAKPHLNNIYKGKDHSRLWLGSYARAPKIVHTKNRAFSGHDNLDDLSHHAFYQDALAVLLRHDALITTQVNKESATHDMEGCVRFGELLVKRLAQLVPETTASERRGFQLLIGEGGTDAHTSNPGGRMVSERLGLSSIARFMLRGINGGNGSRQIDRPGEAAIAYMRDIA